MCVFAGIYDPAFIAANQEARADNIIKGSRQQQVEEVRQNSSSRCKNSRDSGSCCSWNIRAGMGLQVRTAASGLSTVSTSNCALLAVQLMSRGTQL